MQRRRAEEWRGVERWSHETDVDLLSLTAPFAWSGAPQVLFWVGCQEVVIVGMDHSFAQKGSPGKCVSPS